MASRSDPCGPQGAVTVRSLLEELSRTFLFALLVSATACQPALPAGSSARTLSFAGTRHSYVLHRPTSKSPDPALVVVLHGINGSGAGIQRRTRGTFDKLANRDGFIVAYPDAQNGVWNAGHTYEKSDTDDVQYLSALIDTLSSEFHIDPKRIFVTGFSNGASMTYRIACERPDRIAAIAPVGGGLAEKLMRGCAAASNRPVPLLLIHGTADQINRFDDGELEGNVQYWIRRNGCSLTATRTWLTDTIKDGTRTRVEAFDGCAHGADVLMYAVEGGGHHWPGGDEPPRRDNGREIRDFDAGIVIWDFFNKHPMPATE